MGEQYSAVLSGKMRQQDQFIINGAADAPLTVVLAHGAGAPMDSPFMETVAQRLAGPSLRIVRFEFDYMRSRRAHGKRSAPDREPILLGAWREVIQTLGGGSRLNHLKSLQTPTLIVQGTRDSFGNQDEVRNYRLSSQIRIAWIDDGDHSFKPRARSGRTADGNLNAAIEAVRDFLKALPR